jgi:hypothetical protein
MNKNVTWAVVIVLAVLALAVVAGLLHFIFSHIGFILLLVLLGSAGYLYFNKKKTQG